MSSSSSSSGGVGFFGLLTVVFTVLKLVGVIAWPWLWVLAPMWIALALAIFVVVIIVAIVRHSPGMFLKK